MKPLFGIDLTQDKHNERSNCQAFLVDTVSPESSAALDRAVSDAQKLQKKTSLPIILQIVMTVCAILPVSFVLGFLRAFSENDDLTLAQAFQNAGELLAVAVVFFLIFLALLIYSKTRKKRIAAEMNAETLEKRLEQMTAAVYNELGVPENAPAVELLVFGYQMKDGEVKPKAVKAGVGPYANIEFRVYTEGGRLYIADVTSKYAVDRSALRNIRMVKKAIRLPAWIKPVPHDYGVYKQFKITVDQYGVYMKYHYALEFEQDGELWGIYFPSYELPAIKEILGIA